MEASIHVELTTEDLIKYLEKQFGDNPNRKLLAKVIVNNLTTSDDGLRQLYLAIGGIIETIPYNISEKVLFKYEGQATWYTNKDKMMEAGFVKKGYLEGIIKSINPYKKDQIEISYKGVDDKGEPVERETEVPLKNVQKIDDHADEFVNEYNMF